MTDYIIRENKMGALLIIKSQPTARQKWSLTHKDKQRILNIKMSNKLIELPVLCFNNKQQ